MVPAMLLTKIFLMCKFHINILLAPTPTTEKISIIESSKIFQKVNLKSRGYRQYKERTENGVQNWEGIEEVRLISSCCLYITK